MEIITSLSRKELEELICDTVNRCLDAKLSPPSPEVQDRCLLQDACEITGLSRAAIYKLTSEKRLPHMKFGQRLVFSRRQLAAWVEERTVAPPDPVRDIKDGLTRSAEKKLRHEEK